MNDILDSIRKTHRTQKWLSAIGPCTDSLRSQFLNFQLHSMECSPPHQCWLEAATVAPDANSSQSRQCRPTLPRAMLRLVDACWKRNVGAEIHSMGWTTFGSAQQKALSKFPIFWPQYAKIFDKNWIAKERKASPPPPPSSLADRRGADKAIPVVHAWGWIEIWMFL